jgi:hypothetical protein
MGDRQAHRIAIGLDVEVDVGNPFRVLSVLRERPGQYEATRRRIFDHLSHDVDEARIVEVLVPQEEPIFQSEPLR